MSGRPERHLAAARALARIVARARARVGRARRLDEPRLSEAAERARCALEALERLAVVAGLEREICLIAVAARLDFYESWWAMIARLDPYDGAFRALEAIAEERAALAMGA